MINMLKGWTGTIEINGDLYDSVQAPNIPQIESLDNFHIKLHPNTHKGVNGANMDVTQENTQYRITVKKYMTQKANPKFDFMLKWNSDVPMPLRTMIGTIEKETRGMYYMKLHGDIYAERICTCMKCGKTLTNPVSQYFGIGPECGGHNYVNPFGSDEELHNAISEYRAKLQSIVWEGWVIKSAIVEREVVDV